MTENKRYEYNIHVGNSDDYGDPLLGVSRIDSRDSGLLVPRPLMGLELVDSPKPIVIEGLVAPTREQVLILGGGRSKYNTSNGIVSFIEYYGAGESADLKHITDTIVSFVVLAMSNARKHSIQLHDSLSATELEAIQAAEHKAHRTFNGSDESSESNLGTGMYL